MEGLVTHKGGCHCGRVRWEVDAPASVVVWECDCSNCAMRRNTSFIVPEARFRLQPGSEEWLSLYTFGTHQAKHLFCKVCGICSYYKPRSNPDGVSVTVHCVDPGTLRDVQVKCFDGKNWEASFAASNISKLSKEEN
ncbi:hypothetical protein SELMODRAFT_97543 [Selaginella moellendorffii]|uniref:CENP-V/GFA domain-containing protein n=1 Tax=Selaginella moellendorffii TaxID=88036 RepID=D8RMT3_SELML|nr:centromere protein V [Selaginella moellendorffii]XP_002984331.1 centromere protein V [Selaginella moellendorffii]EFJ14841.1 hypothetical protein SELMODRAFT_119985 [Selaginella moellendorffii]EFJ26586.1 hypothetical protein SELMODRAFT_97543 [Selaginella moellendorffii]|eukprot:XP_002972500.1 centromere protein V [Selaginella moellendorffii]